MELDIYQVDAFAKKSFEGNPAAVCPLDNWLSDKILLKIAEENNLSETAFFVKENNTFALRWFTPEEEVDLCGHATLATAHVIFTYLNYRDQTIQFQTKSGPLIVEKTGAKYSMDFPATMPNEVVVPSVLIDALGVSPKEVLSGFDYIVVLNDESDVRSVSPDFVKLSQLDLRGVVVTSPGKNVDFVSRCFFPKLGVNEDPVTGSAHCELAPYWGQEFGKNNMIAQQLSKRTGIVGCELVNDRVVLKGSAVGYLQGKITIDL
jgi:PhzF family phenazine biosynthesis protein